MHGAWVQSMVRELDPTHKDFPDSSSGEKPACQCRRHKRHRFNSAVRKIWRRTWQPTSVFLAGEPYEQKSLVGYSPQGRTRLKWLRTKIQRLPYNGRNAPFTLASSGGMEVSGMKLLLFSHKLLWNFYRKNISLLLK